MAFLDGDAVGYADGFVDKRRLDYGRTDAYLNLEVLRCHRGRGIEQCLVTKALEYLRKRGVYAALAQYDKPDVWRRGLLHDIGFREIRRYFEMVRKGSGTRMKPRFPEQVEFNRSLIARCSDDTYHRIAAVRNESFEDHFNYSPMSDERLKNVLESGTTVFSVTFAQEGSRTIGFVLGEDRPPEEGDSREREGWVAMLGVVRSHRRRGIGRALLMDSVDWLTDRGVKIIRLLVDADNEKALGLYESVGFEVESAEVLMRKDLADGSGCGDIPTIRA